MVSFRGQTKPEPSSDWAALFPTVILALSLSYGGNHPPPPPPPPLPPPERSKAVQEKLKRWGTPLTATSPHLMESGFRNNGNFCLWNTECGKSLLSSCGIWNTAQGIRNLTNDCNPESTVHWQRPQSTTWNLESTAWNPESKTALDSLTLGELW